MNWYNAMIKEIDKNLMSKFNIAIISITLWIIKAQGMTTEHLIDIMTRLNFTFNNSTLLFNDGSRDYTIYQLLNLCVTSVYPVSKMVTPLIMIASIEDSYKNGYITEQEKLSLEAVL
ncbi:MAG: hypothetical protein PHC75_08685 [Burkholderiales bacterium]|nr:hypothetical protein [Burkholderiales bacterium]